MSGYIVTFFTHYDAVSCSRSLRREGIAVELAPVPRALSSSCGTCAIIDCAENPAPLLGGEFEQLFAVREQQYTLLKDNR